MSKSSSSYLKRFALLALVLSAPAAFANSDLDRKYALESVGVLKAWDNVDGLFADYVSTAYREYFSHQSRFVLQDLSKGDNILTTSRISYNKLIQDPEVLGQLARSTRSQSIVRTRIQKEGDQYRVDIEWLHAPEMETMAHETFTLREPRNGHGFGADELKTRLQQALDKTIHDVPFVGTVTGRDNASATINIGSSSGVEPGDTLTIGTLDQVKHHPLLKQVAEWRFSSTGKIQVEQVDERLSFGRVIEEEPDRQIMRQQKVLEIQHKPAEVNRTEKEASQPETSAEEPPRLGWVSGGLNLGGFNRSYSSIDNTIGKDGGGFAFGVKTQGQLWITREWFTELGLNFAYFPYSQKDTTPGGDTASTSLGSGTFLGFKVDGGYSYLVNGDLFGPKGWLKLGYQSNAYSLPNNGAEFLTPITFHSLFVGLGGEMPIRGEFGANVDFNIGVLNSASESTNMSGSTKSASDVSFSIGGFYRYTPRITFKATIDGQFNGADFTNNRSVSQHSITFVPSVVYFF